MLNILHTLPRHAKQLDMVKTLLDSPHMGGCKYIVVAIDAPSSFNRQASWASSFNPDDTHKLFQALADQTRE